MISLRKLIFLVLTTLIEFSLQLVWHTQTRASSIGAHHAFCIVSGTIFSLDGPHSPENEWIINLGSFGQNRSQKWTRFGHLAFDSGVACAYQKRFHLKMPHCFPPPLFSTFILVHCFKCIYSHLHPYNRQSCKLRYRRKKRISGRLRRTHCRQWQFGWWWPHQRLHGIIGAMHYICSSINALREQTRTHRQNADDRALNSTVDEVWKLKCTKK